MTFIVFATDLSYRVLFKQEDLSKDNTVRINGLVTSTFLTKTDVIHIDFRKSASQKVFLSESLPKDTECNPNEVGDRFRVNH